MTKATESVNLLEHRIRMVAIEQGKYEASTVRKRLCMYSGDNVEGMREQGVEI